MARASEVEGSSGSLPGSQIVVRLALPPRWHASYCAHGLTSPGPGRTRLTLATSILDDLSSSRSAC